MSNSRITTSFSIKNKITICMFFLFIVLMAVVNDPGSLQVYKWLLAIFAISFIMRPFLNLRTISLPDGGFSASFGLGTAIAFLSAWYFSALKVFPFNTIVCILGVLIPGGIATVVSLLRKKNIIKGKSSPFIWDKDTLDKFFFGFAVFTLIFFVAFYVKGFRPEIDFQTEQYMDYGFMQSILRQEKVPPYDIWYAGSTLNYYYLGQASATFLCRVAFVTPEYGYNLMLYTIFTALLMMSFSLCYGILSVFKGMRKKGMIAGGVFGGMAVTLAGNGHYLIYGLFVPLLEKITGRQIVEGDYWFPDSTVYIGNNPDLPDKGKHEYPAYTMILGDLHAHVCNMIFTLPLLILLFDYAATKYAGHKNEDMQAKSESKKDIFISVICNVFSRTVILLGILTGLYRGVNYWDFPIYFVVSGAIILFTDLLCSKKGVKNRLVTTLFVLIKGAVILAIGTIVMIPFNLRFVKMASHIRICQNHSQLYKLAILWGIPFLLAIWLIVYLFVKCRKEKRKITSPELGCILMALCAMGLVLVPEVIYVEDIYGDAYARFNTMFKLTFQAFILFGIVMGVLAGLLYNDRRKDKSGNEKISVLNVIGAVIVSAIVIMLSGYTVSSVKGWFGNVFEASSRKCISSIDDMAVNDADYGAIGVIKSDPQKVINIVETAGLSYSLADRVSAFTGACTVRGWHTHEWLWRNDPVSVNARGDEVKRFYEAGDELYCLNFIRKYNIKYIYVGEQELKDYMVNYSGFLDISDVVWNNSAGDHFLLKVKEDI